MENQTEEFRDIKGCEGVYQVSNLGRVKSLKFGKEKILKQFKNGSGYLTTCIHRNNTQKNMMIHQLVAIHFLNHTPNGFIKVVDHKDNDKRNNTCSNLQLITHRENNSKDKKSCSSVFTGVSWCKRAKKWKSTIRIKGKSKHLGYFIKEQDASDVYQEYLLKTL